MPPQVAYRAKAALFTAMFVTGIGNSFVFAILPPIGRELGFIEIQIGSIIMASSAFFMLCAPLWGTASEKWGRKPVIMFALVAYCTMTTAFAYVIQLRLAGALSLTMTYALLVLFRIMFASGISGVFPAAQAYMADITSLERRTSGMALVGIAMGTGMIAGPAVAAGFAGFGLVLPFYAVAMLAIPAFAVVWFFMVEPPRDPSVTYHPSERVRKRDLLPFFGISTGMMITLSSIQVATGFYFQDKFELTTVQTAQHVGLALMASAVASVSCQLFLVHRMGLQPKRLIRMGVPFAFLGVLLLITMDYYPFLVVAMGTFGLGMGMVMPGNIATLSMRAGLHQQGRIAGINTSAQGMGFLIGPLLGSGLYQIHPLLPYGTCLGILGLLMINVYFIAELPG